MKVFTSACRTAVGSLKIFKKYSKAEELGSKLFQMLLKNQN